MTRSSILANLASAAALAVLSVTPALADVRATLLLTSGSRIAVDIVDLNASGLVVREAGRERAIPADEVAVIDFTGDARGLPGNETGRAGGGLVVLRGGQLVDGRLEDIGGTAPLRLSVSTRDGMRDFTSDEVARVYLRQGPWGGGEATPPAAQLPGQSRVRVEGARLWTPTGIYVRRGERVFISAEGEIRLSADPNDVATPYGSTSQRYAAGAPMPRELAGALIGRIGDAGRPFGLGNPNAEVPMPGDGQLWLGINDDAVGDNTGAFTVEVRGGSARPATPRRRQ